jgi:CheY-like chemotaxis protein
VSTAREIVLAAERAADLTRQMLAYSGKGRFLIEPFDLNQLIRENLVLLRASLSRAITVELELSCDSCFVEGDRIQIHQVIMNLLINASEACGELPGKVAIRSTTIERQQEKRSDYLHTLVPPGNYAMLEVRDEGCGMSEETLKKIFDPFFTTKFVGRGLGLAAVLGIVKGHRGDIEVESKVGAGTTFRIFLPVSHRSAGPVQAKSAPKNLLGTDRTVLVVDDEATVRNTARLALERAGFRVLTANHGVEALDVLSRETGISLVILDLTMPVMTGEQALPLIRERHPDVPVVLSSGFNEAEIVRRFSDAGIAGVLQKPYRSSSIVSKVTEALFEAS